MSPYTTPRAPSARPRRREVPDSGPWGAGRLMSSGGGRVSQGCTPIPKTSQPERRPCRRPPHLPGPPLPEGEEGERQKTTRGSLDFFLRFPSLPSGERGRGVRASEGTAVRG